MIDACWTDPKTPLEDQTVDDCVRSQKKASWDLESAVTPPEEMARSISTVMELMQKSPKQECIASWNPNNNVDGYVFSLSPQKISFAKGSVSLGEFPVQGMLGYIVPLNSLMSGEYHPMPIVPDAFTINVDKASTTLNQGDSSHAIGNSFVFYKKDQQISLLTADELLENPAYYHTLSRCFHLYTFALDTQKRFFAYGRYDKTVSLRPIKIRFDVLLDQFDERNGSPTQT